MGFLARRRLRKRAAPVAFELHVLEERQRRLERSFDVLMAGASPDLRHRQDVTEARLRRLEHRFGELRDRLAGATGIDLPPLDHQPTEGDTP